MLATFGFFCFWYKRVTDGNLIRGKSCKAGDMISIRMFYSSSRDSHVLSHRTCSPLRWLETYAVSIWWEKACGHALRSTFKLVVHFKSEREHTQKSFFALKLDGERTDTRISSYFEQSSETSADNMVQAINLAHPILSSEGDRLPSARSKEDWNQSADDRRKFPSSTFQSGLEVTKTRTDGHLNSSIFYVNKYVFNECNLIMCPLLSTHWNWIITKNVDICVRSGGVLKVILTKNLYPQNKFSSLRQNFALFSGWKKREEKRRLSRWEEDSRRLMIDEAVLINLRQEREERSESGPKRPSV